MTRKNRLFLGGLLAVLLLAGVVSNFASGAPDGLESVAAKGCVLDEAGEVIDGTCIARNTEEHELGDSPFADYAVRGIDNDYLATGLSGVTGALLTLAIAGGIFWLIRSRRTVKE
ncbi:MAG TPA: PDGLE domain-containing protein [Micromonosporaceae bacterium]